MTTDDALLIIAVGAWWWRVSWCATLLRKQELEDARRTARRELEALEGKRDELRELQRDAAALLEAYEGTVPEELENLAPEERRHIYNLLQLRCLLRPNEPPELTGVFAAGLPKVRDVEGVWRSTSAKMRKSSCR